MKYGQERTWRKTKGIEPRNRDLSSNVDLNTLQTKFLYSPTLSFLAFTLHSFTFTMIFRTSTNEAPKTPSSPPSSPRKPSMSIANVANIFIKMRRSSNRVKSHHIESSSGEPQSHPGVVEAMSCAHKEEIQFHDVFVCIGAVNVTTLLRATRDVLMDVAENLGANALVDEQYVSYFTVIGMRSPFVAQVDMHNLCPKT